MFISQKNQFTYILFCFFLLFSLLIRLANLNYNAPFNDEAIYIVIGRLGVFQWDWWAYNAQSWMAGQPYIYPSIAALSYVTGGIVGSRLLNVIFGVLTIETIFIFSLLLFNRNDNRRFLAGLISAILLGASAVSLYISRLATLDMPSFYFFFLGLVFLIRALIKDQNNGRTYFMSSMLILLGCLTKIIVVVYLPAIIIYSYLRIRKMARINRFFWIRYFAAPLILGVGSFVLINFQSLLIYFSVQASREKGNFTSILHLVWDNTGYLFWILVLVGSLGMLYKRKWIEWFILVFGGSLIILTHLTSQRLWSLDKHLFLTLAFFSIICGVGLSYLVYSIHYKSIRILAVVLIFLMLALYSLFSYQDAQKYNRLWADDGRVLEYLSKTVKSGDKVLTEGGASIILATYDNNYPPNTTTFDWFEYQGSKGEQAYSMAVKNTYFDYIELEGEENPKDAVHSKVHTIVKKNLYGIYKLLYSKDGFYVYGRNT